MHDDDEYFIRTIEFDNIPNEVKIYQQTIGDVGHVVWDAAIVLAKYVDCNNFKYDLQEKKVVELGSGTGLVGIVAAMKGAQTFITDLPEVLSLMEKNIVENQTGDKFNITAKTLKWGEDVDKQLLYPDYVFIADCIYYEESLDPLVNTMVAISSTSTKIYLSYEERDTEKKVKLQNQFFKLLLKHFHMKEIPTTMQDPTFSSPDIHVIHLTLKLIEKS